MLDEYIYTYTHIHMLYMFIYTYAFPQQLVVRELLRKGVVGVKDMVGGLEAWATQVDPSFPAY